MQNSIAATQTIANKAASPGTKIEVHGTRHGALGDDYRLLWNYDSREVIDNGLKVRSGGGYDAFVIANSLDPGLIELREMLDVPVVSLMEVCCHTACMMGERFGILTTSDKFISRFREMAFGYGLRDRLAAVEAIRFDDIRAMNGVFDSVAGAEALLAQLGEAARRAIDKGAEVLIAPGPKSALLASRGIYKIEGVPLLDCYSLLIKMTEALVAMHRITGTCVSRKRLYKSPPAALLIKAAESYGVDELKNG